MSYKIIVLAKQVPDTRNVGKDAMKADGTVNRGALPAIYNPEDLNALEFALSFKDKHEDAEITVITMGPPRAAEIIRESLYRGADKGYLITDRKFAGSDTLATSYALSMAIRKIKDYDVVIAGRQAIDGDTAQVGPQVAEKLDLPQITYAKELIEATKDKKIKILRSLDNGVETVAVKCPAVVTVHSSAKDARMRDVKRMMKYKYAKTYTELQDSAEDYTNIYEERPYLNIEEWSVADIKADTEMLGLGGSPTKVKKVESVVFTKKESTKLSGSDEDVEKLMKDLIDSHVIG